MTSALHPVFESILRPFMQPSAETWAYRNALSQHDWAYQYTDDHSVYRAGRNQRDWLDAMQPGLDPDCAIWNAHAPQGYRK